MTLSTEQEIQYLPFVQRDENGSGGEIGTNPTVYFYLSDGGDAEGLPVEGFATGIG